MTVTKEDPPKVVQPKPITLAGRTIPVKLPTLDQAMEWEVTLRAIARMEKEGIDYETLKIQKDRFYRIMKGLFVNDADKEWIDGARLDGIVSLDQEEVISLMTNVINAHKNDIPGGPANRSAKRAAARKRS